MLTESLGTWGPPENLRIGRPIEMAPSIPPWGNETAEICGMYFLRVEHDAIHLRPREPKTLHSLYSYRKIQEAFQRHARWDSANGAEPGPVERAQFYMYGMTCSNIQVNDVLPLFGVLYAVTEVNDGGNLYLSRLSAEHPLYRMTGFQAGRTFSYPLNVMPMDGLVSPPNVLPHQLRGNRIYVRNIDEQCITGERPAGLSAEVAVLPYAGDHWWFRSNQLQTS